MAERSLTDAVVVCLGASSGIGRATAIAFARQGAHVVLCARSAGSLEEVATICRAAGAASARSFAFDVTDVDAVERMLTSVDRELGAIDVWVAAASVYSVGPFAETPGRVVRRVLEVNLSAQVEAVHRALPHLRPDRGVIVLVGSVFSAVAAPLVVPYVTAKHGLAGFAKALRLDLRGRAKVCLVLPATIDTPIYQHAANTTGHRIRPLPPSVPAARVARAIVRVARRPRRRVIVGAVQGAAVFVRPLMPRLFDAVMSAAMRRIGVGRERRETTDGTLFGPDERSNAVSSGWHRARRTGRRS